MDKIDTNTSAEAAAANSDLVCEAVAENLPLKQRLFKGLDEACHAGTLFASNTSSLSIRDIAQDCSAERQAKFGGLHFFNPVPMMRLLEVVKVTDMTSDETFEKLLKFGQDVGKVTVECKDTPGFLVNRL